MYLQTREFESIFSVRLVAFVPPYNSLTLELLHHVDLDTVQDVDHIVNRLPFVVQRANQTRNMSEKNAIEHEKTENSCRII